MKAAILLCCALVASAAYLLAESTTRETTRPTSVEQAEAAVAEATRNCFQRLNGNNDYKSAKDNLERTRIELESARSTGTPQDKLAASAAFVKASELIKKMESDALSRDSSLSQAKTLLLTIQSEAATAKRLKEEEVAKAAEKKLGNWTSKFPREPNINDSGNCSLIDIVQIRDDNSAVVDIHVVDRPTVVRQNILPNYYTVRAVLKFPTKGLIDGRQIEGFPIKMIDTVKSGGSTIPLLEKLPD